MLEQRIRTALILGALLLIVLFALPAWAVDAVITVAIFAAAWEWSLFTGRAREAGVAMRVAFIATLALVIGSLAIPAAPLIDESVVLGIAIAWWLVAFGWVTLAPGVSPWPSGALAGVLTLAPAWYALVHLRGDFVAGDQWLLFLLLLVTATDSGAYFIGRRFGRVKLAPRVSPGKTWEGVFGGLAAGSLMACAGAWWFSLPLAPFLALGIAVIAFSIVGDLTESLFKRRSGVKDSGTLFPGHGGVLDRIDSLTAAAPVLLAGLHLLGVR